MSESKYYHMNKKCKCSKKKQEAKMINYSLMWHDGDIVCDNCKCYIRSYDAG